MSTLCRPLPKTKRTRTRRVQDAGEAAQRVEEDDDNDDEMAWTTPAASGAAVVAPATPVALLEGNETVAVRLREDVNRVANVRLPAGLELTNLSTDGIQLLSFIQRTGVSTSMDRSACISVIGQFMWRSYRRALLDTVAAAALNARAFFVNPCAKSKVSLECRRRFVVLRPPDRGRGMSVLQVNLCSCGMHLSPTSRWQPSSQKATATVFGDVRFVEQLSFVMSVLWADTTSQVFLVNEVARFIWAATA